MCVTSLNPHAALLKVLQMTTLHSSGEPGLGNGSQPWSLCGFPLVPPDSSSRILFSTFSAEEKQLRPRGQTLS